MNLFSLTSELSKKGALSNDDLNKIVIEEDGTKIVFDLQVHTCDGWMYGVDVLPSEVQYILNMLLQIRILLGK